MKILLQNAQIVDGTGKKDVYLSDLLIEDDKIAKIGNFTGGHYDKVIDLEKKYLSPGFIDAHSHTELAYLLPNGLKGKIAQGVTSEINGQCGLGIFPIEKNLQEKFRKNLIIGRAKTTWPWQTTKEFLTLYDKMGLESNMLPSIGHGVLRYNILQDKNQAMSPYQIKQMVALAEDAFRNGIKILTFGFIYVPALFYHIKEIKALIAVASRYHIIVSVHLESESDKIVASLTKMIDLTKNTNCTLNISHLKIIGDMHQHKLPKIFELIEKNKLSFDSYPFNYGSTTLFSLIPPEFLDKRGIKYTLENLSSPKVRKQIENAINLNKFLLPWDNLLKFLGPENIFIDSLEKNKTYIGKNLAELDSSNPIDFMLKLLVQEQGNILMRDIFMPKESVYKIFSHPNGVVSTDSIISSSHPRNFITFPKILADYVFRKKHVTLEKAIHKMTGKTAEIFGIKKRGVIRKGYFADLVVFSKDISYHDDRVQGLEYVFVNGKIKLEKGKYHQIKSGELLLSENLSPIL